MALFQQFQRKDSLFELIQDQSSETGETESFARLIVGLGNIGKEYEGTRHNIGFAAIDAYQKEHGFPGWQEKTKFKAYVSEDFIAGKKVILAKPATYMNLSGEAIRALKDFYKLQNDDITVIHDELDLPLGTVKEKQGGGSAGNNGLKSIISHIGEDFKRIRIGIKNDLLAASTGSGSTKKMDAADFVLAKFSSEEKKQLNAIIKAALEKL